MSEKYLRHHPDTLLLGAFSPKKGVLPPTFRTYQILKAGTKMVIQSVKCDNVIYSIKNDFFKIISAKTIKNLANRMGVGCDISTGPIRSKNEDDNLYHDATYWMPMPGKPQGTGQ
jgi:hypothetical protein